MRGPLEVSDSPQRLYLDLCDLICHDPWLPLLFDPNEANSEIPADAAWCCERAHKFEAERHLTEEVLSKMKRSLIAGKLHEILERKKVAEEQGDTKRCFIQIGLGLKTLGLANGVLELWPCGHRSRKRHFFRCARSTRLLHGNLVARLYKTNESKEPMLVSGLSFKSDGSIELQAAKTMWLNENHWYIQEIHAPTGPGIVQGGFALSLNVSRSCGDEVSFVVDHGAAGSPPHDLFWNIDLPSR